VEIDKLFHLSQVRDVFHEAEDAVSRRDFLSVMAASIAMAGLSACRSAPPEKIVPYVSAPEDLLPGKPQFFATAMPQSGYGIGLIVESHEGRPIKVEGNPNHPASLGATDVFAQASPLTLYDPARAQTVTQAAAISTWDEFVVSLQPRLSEYDTNGGAGLRILTETVTSPSLGFLLQQLLRKYPNARWHQFEPVNRDNARAGARLAFGRYVDAVYHLDDADIIVSFDSDFLMWGPGKLRYAREFARRRKTPPGENRLNRLYVFEAAPSITGAKADHRFRARSTDIAYYVRLLAPAVRAAVQGQPTGIFNDSPLSAPIADLLAHRGRSVVLAGDDQPADVHALVHLMNDLLGNAGKTVRYIEPVEATAVAQTESLRELADDIEANRVTTLVTLGGNPVYTAPADFEFARRLARVPLRIHQSLFFDETSQLSHWHIPETHYLESWSDVRAFDGTTSIIQPLIVPLYQSRTALEIVSALLGNPSRSNYELVRGYWQTAVSDPDFDGFWKRALRDGMVPDTASASIAATAAPDLSRYTGAQTAEPPVNPIEIVFKPDPTVFDGRWSHNSWLQELPKPITQLSWDNAALISPATAAQLNVQTGDIVEIEQAGRKASPAVMVVEGVANNSITLHLGYGRIRGGRTGSMPGFNVFSLRASTAMSSLVGPQLRRTGLRYNLVTTQRHHEMAGRHMARSVPFGEYSKSPDAVRNEERPPEENETLYPPHQPVGYAWGMTIDLSSCIGCNACVVACQAENNVPVVGKDQVDRGREMHWLRIDAYLTGDPQNPEVLFEPMLCQHCENAPCELVCPVEATSHSAEGINEMTYNRCVGTRYCSNNCPYKVRRFNFLQYADWNTPQLKLLYNPDVTVRSRGVMEKCTYCIQRINRARIDAKLEDRRIRDGEVVTACQQVCPAEAIVFGDLLDRNSAVMRTRSEPRNYGVLEELNTRPRTTYLAKLKNPRTV
jgi:Fe-S-cluster-containing dehydrogenase component